MKNRFDSYKKIYQPFVENHLGNKSLQNIIVTGNVDVEFKRHNFLNYEKLISYDNHYVNYQYGETDNTSIVMDNVFSPKNPTESVNLIFFDGQWFGENDEEQQPKNLVKNLTNGIKKVLEGAFKNNKLGIVVVVYSDCMGIDDWVEDSNLDIRKKTNAPLDTYEGIEIPFYLLKQNYGNYKIKDFFHKKISFTNQDKVTETSLSGVVFYEG